MSLPFVYNQSHFQFETIVHIVFILAIESINYNHEIVRHVNYMSIGFIEFNGFSSLMYKYTMFGQIPCNLAT